MNHFQTRMHLIIFILLTATSPAVAKYAKRGCIDKCGNITIPYPFGIGTDCAVNHWYIINCNNGTPYLSAPNNLEVLGVELTNQRVTVSIPRISRCQNPTGNSSEITGVNLGTSPFLFSKDNKFVFEGCGTAALIVDNENVVTGCSTTCLNVTFSLDRNNAVGNGYCQTYIDHNFKSYTIMLMGLERQVEDGACSSSFLAYDISYDQKGWFNDPFNRVSLLWTLKDTDQITCCYKDIPERLIVDMFNGSAVDTLSCKKGSQLTRDNPYLIDGCTDNENPKHVKRGCNDTCGNNVMILYPFGIGAKCAINQWYIVDCNNSTPYLPALNHLEVLDVNLTSQTVAVSTPRVTDCQNPVRNSSEIMGVDLDGSPFFFSTVKNKFIFKGCGNAIMIMDDGSVLTACSTACHGVTLNDKNNCFGIGDCCETTIPFSFKWYKINITSLEEENGGCASAFLVDQTSYDQGMFSVSLYWTLGDSDQVTCCDVEVVFSLDMVDGTTIYTLGCSSSSIEGNPYLIDGCKNINGNEGEQTEECNGCVDRGGYCIRSDAIYNVDGSVFNETFSCLHDKKLASSGVILGVSISMGIVIFVGGSYALFKCIKKTKEKRQRNRFFKRNGGLLLKQQEEADPSLVDKTIHFTSRELQKATDNFSENRILGRGGQGTVYKGMLIDGRIVAVKKSKVVDESQLEQFINEVLILSQINHRNVVKLLGCCLETDVPVLVYEFIPNGTLFERLQNNTDEFPMSLNMRLQIATEVASALAYLHSATSIPIYHRDIKTTNILLDEKYRAKVSDFGTSRFVSIDQTHLTTLVKGTFGYLDPEYFQSSQFTEKSDVYSFGVVLVELLTREKPISRTRFGENRNLATHFMLAMEKGHVMSIFDTMVIKEGTREELQVVANLAMRCLNLSGKYRPTMKEVATELETIRRSHIPFMVQTNIGSVVHGDQLSMISYEESSSTFLSFNDSITR